MNELVAMQSQNHQVQDFDRVRISIASPERIRRWSNGEIKKPETINYRTFKPENDGLFCGRIFGPIKDYECLCGKYKRPKHKGIVCEKCGVEVTVSKVRRERMGHIELAAPVAHIWFLKSAPTRIGTLLDMALKDVENVLYFERFIVTDPGTSVLKEKELLKEEEYEEAKEKYGEQSFTAMIGAEALKHILSQIDVATELQKCRDELAEINSVTEKKKIIKKLKILEGFDNSKARPEWMILDVVPVIPPDLRPLAQLDGGRFATSDLNNLYRRVINRNNRLRRFIDLRAPDIIIRSEKRMLQEAVDALFDNGRRGNAILGNNKRPLKSLSDMLKGKQGRFRQNLLGKRVDYSGRSVIVVGPELKLHQCGLPKKMALELFKPFVCGKLERDGKAINLKAAKKMVEKESTDVWDALEEMIREHPVLLNRAPTLHRLGIQAFEPVLIEGKAIQLHPLVCAAFNADFDGDQMAVHVPLSLEAQLEARVLMMSTNNILSPANGKPIIVPSQDIILGLYYLTLQRFDQLSDVVTLDSEQMLESALHHEYEEDEEIDEDNRPSSIVLVNKDDGREVMEKNNIKELFKRWQAGEFVAYRLPLIATQSELSHALDSGAVHLHSPIKTTYETVNAAGEKVTRKVRTTPGRMILGQILPRHPGLPFKLINRVMKKSEIGELINAVYLHCGQKDTVIFSDRLMNYGFSWACKAGISFGKDDLIIPDDKAKLVRDTQERVKLFEKQYMDGLMTYGEKYNKVLDAWAACSDKVTEEMMKVIIADNSKGVNAVWMMADSGARGSVTQIKQLAGMRGIMARPSGEIIETPIISNFKEGLSVLEYFNSTHGARKGLADTALKTASAGYFTRRLVDVAQDAIVTESDCATERHLIMQPVKEGADVVSPISERIFGRTAAEDITDPQNGKVIVAKGELINQILANKVEAAGIGMVKIRSVLTCESERGVCGKCYGLDLARGTAVNIGEAVGIIAAESIGEPGTQLTMRTFHVGGAAKKEESEVEAEFDGTVKFEKIKVKENSKQHKIVMGHDGKIILLDANGKEAMRQPIPYGAKLFVTDDQKVTQGQLLVQWDPSAIRALSPIDGTVRSRYLVKGETMQEKRDEVTGFSRMEVIEWIKRSVIIGEVKNITAAIAATKQKDTTKQENNFTQRTRRAKEAIIDDKTKTTKTSVTLKNGDKFLAEAKEVIKKLNLVPNTVKSAASYLTVFVEDKDALEKARKWLEDLGIESASKHAQESLDDLGERIDNSIIDDNIVKYEMIDKAYSDLKEAIEKAKTALDHAGKKYVTKQIKASIERIFNELSANKKIEKAKTAIIDDGAKTIKPEVTPRIVDEFLDEAKRVIETLKDVPSVFISAADAFAKEKSLQEQQRTREEAKNWLNNLEIEGASKHAQESIGAVEKSVVAEILKYETINKAYSDLKEAVKKAESALNYAKKIADKPQPCIIVESDTSGDSHSKYPRHGDILSSIVEKTTTTKAATSGEKVKIKASDEMMQTFKESGKTKDIIGGLPRVVNLFEARGPEDAAILADQDGTVDFGDDDKNKSGQKIIIKPAKEGAKESVFIVPSEKHVNFQEGDFVKRGDVLIDGELDPHDVLAVRGEEALADYLVREVQSVYRLQGVKISDKHIEVIVRQMLQKVEITDSGDSLMFIGDQYNRRKVNSTNQKMEKDGKKPAKYKPILQSITRAALKTDSFISAASFQETTKVLTEAAVEGKSDYLEGLKENVIVGRLVPAGTGAVVNKIRKIAAARDKAITDQRRASSPPSPSSPSASSSPSPSGKGDDTANPADSGGEGGDGGGDQLSPPDNA